MKSIRAAAAMKSIRSAASMKPIRLPDPGTGVGVGLAFAGLTVLLVLAALDGPVAARERVIPDGLWMVGALALGLGVLILAMGRLLIAFDVGVAVLLAALIANLALTVVSVGRLDCMIGEPVAAPGSSEVVAIRRSLFKLDEPLQTGSVTLAVVTRQTKPNDEVVFETKQFEAEIAEVGAAEKPVIVSVKRGEEDQNLSAILTALADAQRVDVFTREETPEPKAKGWCFWAGDEDDDD